MIARLKVGLGVFAFALVIAAMAYHAVWGFDLVALSARLETILHESRSAWSLLLVLQVAIAATGVLPASALCILSGMIFGFGIGFGLSAMGTFLGAFFSFWLTRSLLRPTIRRWLERSHRFQRLDAVFSVGGWRLVCLARLSPVMPFALTSLSLGVSSVSFREYALGSLTALPAMAGYVAAGVALRDGLGAWAGGGQWLGWASMAVGAVATLALVIYVGRAMAQAFTVPAHGAAIECESPSRKAGPSRL